MNNNGAWRVRPPRKPSIPEVETQVKFDNPDDADLEPEVDSAVVIEDVDSQVVLDNPDDGDMYPPGEEPENLV